MKNHQKVESRKSRVESRQNSARFSRPRPSTLDPRQAFTLIELLVVIAIIGVLAAFIFSVAPSVKRSQYISQTRAEMGKLELAIEGYRDAYGFYPPGNPGYPANSSDAYYNPLYYELMGSTNNGVNYVTLDGSAQIPVASVSGALGVNGFVNCTKPGTAEDASPAKSFLSGLKPQEFGIVTTNIASPLYNVALLLGAAGGPDLSYQPLNNGANQNPWRYVAPGVNNPNSYDLWMQLVIGGKTNLVCNWSKQVQINQPFP